MRFLGVQTNGVVVGDPLTGLNVIPEEEFENNWLFVGIVFNERASDSAHADQLGLGHGRFPAGSSSRTRLEHRFNNQNPLAESLARLQG